MSDVQLATYGPGLWIADGPRVSFFGPFTLPTRMMVVKLADGALWINSPIETSADEMDRVAELGPVRHLVAPTKLHVWRLAAWKTHFPDARTWEPPEILSDEAPPAWANDLDQAVFRGSAILEEIEFFHRASRTLIFTDFIQNYRFMRGVPPDIRLSFIRRAQGKASLQRILAWDFENLVIAHGEGVTGNAKAFVRSAFAWL